MSQCTYCGKIGHRASSCDRRKGGLPGLMLACLLLAGCDPAPKELPPQQIRIIADTYCASTDEQSWSTQDTSPTIDGVRKANASRDSRCLKGKR